MIIDHLILGAYQTNCYVLRISESARDCLIIDTGLEATGLVDFLIESKLNPIAVVLTHGHVDHIWGLSMLRDNFPNIKAYIHKLDAKMLTEPSENLSALTGGPYTVEPADFLLEDGDITEQAGIKLSVLHTPGHTPGGISLYIKDEGIIFVGDTLFADSVGRTDLPGGNTEQLIQSIKQKLLTLPGETIVYPGHGPATTVARENTYNQFLQ
jgi:hydroxyacylglutathione hydrolase